MPSVPEPLGIVIFAQLTPSRTVIPLSNSGGVPSTT